jgi:hypothetical protein
MALALKHGLALLFLVSNSLVFGQVSLALLPWESREDDREVSRDFASLTEFFLISDSNLTIVDRSRLDNALDELALAVSGTVNPADAARIGSLVGAQVMISGRLIQSGEEWIALSRIMGVETMRVFSERVRFSADSIDEAAEDLASRISARILAERAQLFGDKSTPGEAERLAAIQALAQSKQNLPRISVQVPEFHIGRLIPDPAGETEIIRLLDELGFTLVSPSSGEPVDFKVTGEAFSETALELRGLISSRARVEVILVEEGTGQIIYTDGVHTTAVDSAEFVAGKEALRRGGHHHGLAIAEVLLRR